MKKSVFLITTMLTINVLGPTTTYGHINHTPPLLNSESAIVIDASIPAGTTVGVEDRMYTAPKDLFYTHPLDQKVNEEVNDNGTLNIINQENTTIISSFQLDKFYKNERTQTKMDAESVSGGRQDQLRV